MSNDASDEKKLRTRLLDPPSFSFLAWTRTAQCAVAKFNNHPLKSGTMPTSREAAQARELASSRAIVYSIPGNFNLVLFVYTYIYIYMRTHAHNTLIVELSFTYDRCTCSYFFPFSLLLSLLRRYACKRYRFANLWWPHWQTCQNFDWQT